MVVVGLRGRQLFIFCFMTMSVCFGDEVSAQQYEETPEVPTVPSPEKTTPSPQEPTPTQPIDQPTTPTVPASALSAPATIPAETTTNAGTPVSVVPGEVVPAVTPTQPLSAPMVPSIQPPVPLPPATQAPTQVPPVAMPAPSPAALPQVAPAQPVVVTPTPAAAISPSKVVEPVVATEVKKQPIVATPTSAIAAPTKTATAPQKNVAKQPEATPQVQEPSPSEIGMEEEELVGIDTVDLEEPQGNWLFKRLWWERAEEKYEEIRSLEAEVLELRMPFFMKRTDVDRSVLDPFYLHVAKDRGALEILLSDIGDFLAQEESREGMLDETERGMRDQLQAERETLEQLQKNIQAILNFDRELDVAIGTLMDQLNRVSEYEREAWHYFKEIGRVLNDKKAREYVLKMKNIQRNIKEIQEYIQERFAMYFDQLIATIKENVDQVTVAMDKLQEKGIDLKEQLGQIKEQKNAPEADEEEEAPRLKIDNRGFFERYILDPISSFFETIWNGIVAVVKWPYNLIFGSKKPAPVIEIEQEEVAVEPVEEPATEESED